MSDGITLSLTRQEAAALLSLAQLGLSAYWAEEPDREVRELLERMPNEALEDLTFKLYLQVQKGVGC